MLEKMFELVRKLLKIKKSTSTADDDTEKMRSFENSAEFSAVSKEIPEPPPIWVPDLDAKLASLKDNFNDEKGDINTEISCPDHDR